MNEQQNIALIRSVYEAFGAGNIQEILRNVADDADWINYGPETVPYAGSRRGHTQVLQFFEAIASSTADGKVVPENFLAQGDTVVATGRFSATVRNTGAKIDTPVAHFFTIRNGKIAKWVGFSDSAHVADAHTRAAAAAR